MDTRHAPASIPSGHLPVRRRLPPALRIHQILDAALVQFAEGGYAETRMDDIARRAGLSKGGLYAHFRSKERVFEALLERGLAPLPLDVAALVDFAPDLRTLIERFLAQVYEWIGQPDRIRVLRLLLTESQRVPELVQRWREEAVAQHLRAVTDMLRRARERGLCGDTVLIEQPWLALSPLVHGIVLTLTEPPGSTAGWIERRDAHVRLLCEVLGATAR
ncbi:TetR family transcriptional regulator [Bordetella genomosp. 5]|uniref:TetR/AcrR family transcriptional regulator n=1 Tax=Bordetella genomosp. 5 TaxID=1395608 RepID=UPI000B9ED3C4|nr:TetR/AcrR family transcriptional regulator [Bordetella genomosp. 5]OZI43585.1 TetR family transcriptional regulator [Bordetella genomosp. 5]